MVTYDPAIIVKFAQRLYDRALLATIAWALAGTIVGGVIGAAISASLNAKNGNLVIAAAVVGLVVGVMIGLHRSFMLKLQAQQALCMLQIEINTRPTVMQNVHSHSR